MKTLTKILLVFLLTLGPALAERDGWDRDSEYSKHFDSSSIVYFSGEILEIDRQHVPLPGMQEGLAVKVRTDDGQTRLVEVGPTWFTDYYKQRWDIEVGDRVEIRGSKTMVGERPVVIAIWGSKDDQAMTVRSTRGVPVWDLGLDDFWGP